MLTKRQIEIFLELYENQNEYLKAKHFSESMDVEHPYHFYYGFLSLAANLVQELNQPFYKKYKEFCL